MSRWIPIAAGVVATILVLAHPFLHQFEGGSIDAFVQYLTVYANIPR